MSRPRPVTATINKPRWMDMADDDAVAYAHRHSLDSTGSTASLTSILDHNSYESIPSDNEEEIMRHKEYLEQKARLDLEKELNRKVNQMVISDCNTNSQSEPKLSSWEMWVIDKAKEDRCIRKHNLQKAREEKRKKEDLEKEKLLKLQKAEDIRKKWVQSKNEEEKRKRQEKKEEKKRKEMEKKDKEGKILEKSSETFQKWLQDKRKEKLLRKQEERKKRQQEEQEKMEREKRAQEEYMKWQKIAKKRPKSAPSSVGFLAGKLTQYHDTGAYPTPSYCNPIPWQPIHIPKPKNEKPNRSKAKKYVWNPNKYF